VHEDAGFDEETQLCGKAHTALRNTDRAEKTPAVLRNTGCVEKTPAVLRNIGFDEELRLC
jgi:hypothetical protein